jgi:hypothetical protein
MSRRKSLRSVWLCALLGAFVVAALPASTAGADTGGVVDGAQYLSRIFKARSPSDINAALNMAAPHSPAALYAAHWKTTLAASNTTVGGTAVWPTGTQIHRADSSVQLCTKNVPGAPQRCNSFTDFRIKDRRIISFRIDDKPIDGRLRGEGAVITNAGVKARILNAYLDGNGSMNVVLRFWPGKWERQPMAHLASLVGMPDSPVALSIRPKRPVHDGGKGLFVVAFRVSRIGGTLTVPFSTLPGQEYAPTVFLSFPLGASAEK